jgi:hypothetical protein
MEGLYFICPVCGEEVPRGAKSCPECGACEKSGWGDTSYDGLDLPDEDYTTGRRLDDRRAKPPGLSRFWIVVTVLILVALVWLTFRRGF